MEEKTRAISWEVLFGLLALRAGHAAAPEQKNGQKN